MRKLLRLDRLLIALLLIAGGTPVRAQFVGYVGQQTILVPPIQLGMNMVTAATISLTVPNIGQAAHFLTYCVNGGTATTVVIQIEGSVDATAFFAISNQGTNTSGCSTVATGGYFPVVRINLLTYTRNGTTLSATYSATSGTLPFTGGTVSTQVTGTSVNQFGGFPMTTGIGPGGLGIPRISLSNDSQVRVMGNAGGIFDTPTNSAPAANDIQVGFVAAAIGTNPAAVTGGNIATPVSDVTGNHFVRLGGPNPFNCTVTLSSNTTTQCQAAPAAGLRAYVSGYVLNTTTGGTTSTVQLVFGTGANCGTGTTNLSAIAWPNTITGIQQANANQTIPLIPSAANAICAKQAGGVAGTTVVEIYGFIAP